MYCVRQEDVWYCVDDEELMRFLRHKTVPLKVKDEFIINNGRRYYITEEGLYKEVKDD